MEQSQATQAQAPSLAKQVGFTLIELSIVLVIIGLIVGGVLVGQDLIKAAEIRSTIGQYEKYNASINTFRTKYNGIPGDLAAAQSTAFGLDPTAGAHSGGTGLGDSNGLITDSNGTNVNAPVGETTLFWQQLSAASLIDGSFGADLTTAAATATATTGLYFPQAKIGRNYWAVGSSSGLNYYALANLGTITTGAAATAKYNPSKGLTPIEAFNIDTKLDDGAPNTGIVQARGTGSTAAIDGFFATLGASTLSAWSSASAPVAGDCTTGTGTTTGLETTAVYARGTTPGGTPACNLRMRVN